MKKSLSLWLLLLLLLSMPVLADGSGSTYDHNGIRHTRKGDTTTTQTAQLTTTHAPAVHTTAPLEQKAAEMQKEPSTAPSSNPPWGWAIPGGGALVILLVGGLWLHKRKACE